MISIANSGDMPLDNRAHLPHTAAAPAGSLPGLMSLGGAPPPDDPEER
jgi:hypothetical protein